MPCINEFINSSNILEDKRKVKLNPNISPTIDPIEIASIGSLVGRILGLSLTFLLSSRIFEEFINSLMQGTYFISYFPIDVRFSWVFFILFSTIILTLLVCLYPARIASKVIPAEVLRNE